MNSLRRAVKASNLLFSSSVGDIFSILMKPLPVSLNCDQHVIVCMLQLVDFSSNNLRRLFYENYYMCELLLLVSMKLLLIRLVLDL